MEENVNAKKEKKSKLSKKRLASLILVFVAGIVFLAGLRFALIDRHQTHYHANFALYINGQREEFKSFTYYEEVTACSLVEHSNPKSRVHMHGNVNNVLHVHDEGATWAHFFSNLGYVFADDLLRTNTATYSPTPEKNFTYIVNGEVVTSIADRVIGNEDALLINYGNEPAQVIKERYDALKHDAHEYNEKSDPNTCSGGKAETFMERLKRTQLH